MVLTKNCLESLKILLIMIKRIISVTIYIFSNADIYFFNIDTEFEANETFIFLLQSWPCKKSRGTHS